MGSGDMTREELKAFFHKAFSNIAAVTQSGALVYSFIDFRGLRDMLDAGEAIFTELKGVLTWVKKNAGMGALYRSQTEFITLWKQGVAPHRNNINLGIRRYRTTAWTYDGVNSLRPGRDEELAGHPTPKPVQMIADAMLDTSNRGDAILDLFAGGGTVFIAAERTGRVAYGMELDPIYCDLIVRRWQKFIGKQAVLAATGETFEQVAEVRHG
jgi:DNA modification methylase